MQTSKKLQSSAGIQGSYCKAVQDTQQFSLSHNNVRDNKLLSDTDSQGTIMSFQTYKEPFFTLDSSTAAAGYTSYDSPSLRSDSSGRSPFSPLGCQSYLSDPHHSADNMYESPLSMSSVVDDGSEFRHKLRELECSLLRNELQTTELESTDSFNCCLKSGIHQSAAMPMWNSDQLLEMVPKLDLKQVLIYCARAVGDNDFNKTATFMSLLDHMVAINGEPIKRLGAYVLEGLRARLESSGSNIYKALKCEEPTSSELFSYMSVLFQICPYWKFGYLSANVVIKEAMENESRIHIIDFQIAQGTQYVSLIQYLAKRDGGPPIVRITGLDDSQSKHARGGGLHIVGQRLSEVAKSCNVPFEFHDATMSNCEVQVDHLMVHPSYALAVNFPYVLHHMPDESVSVWNHRDRLLRLVKSLSPKVVTLVEQESNTNTSPFFARFLETLDYYTAMFESIDVARGRDDKQRINAEQHCVARDIVNMIACEGPERVERHELFGKWKARFMMAGFMPCPLSSSVSYSVMNMLREYDNNYRLEEKEGALYLRWKSRGMATSSAWM